MIYLNNAATTKPSRLVRKRTAELLEDSWMNPSSVEGSKVKDEIEKSRQIIKDIVHADEVIFISGATEGNNIIRNSGIDVISSDIEHPSNKAVNTIHYKDMRNYSYLKEYCKNHFSDKGILSYIGINNENGYILHGETITTVADEMNNIYVHLDATQLVGHHQVNMSEGINYLTASAHKFGGLKGIGFIAYNNVEPIKVNYGGGQEKGFRSGTENAIGIITMAEQLKDMNDNCFSNFYRVVDLYRAMKKGLSSIPDTFYLAEAATSPYIFNICFKGIYGEALVHLLNMKGVIVSSGSACHSGSVEPSYVLKAFDIPDDYIHGSIRISFSPDNTIEEVKCAAEIIKECVEMLRNMR